MELAAFCGAMHQDEVTRVECLLVNNLGMHEGCCLVLVKFAEACMSIA